MLSSSSFKTTKYNSHPHWQRYVFYTVALAKWEGSRKHFLNHMRTNNVMKLVKDEFQISAVICMPQHQDKLGGNEIINWLQEECSSFAINAQARTAALLGTHCLAQLLHMHDKPSHKATGRT
jgi:hypothetical protein